MAVPKKVKKTLDLSQKFYYLDRREELLDKINMDGTYLPKSILHADLDRGMLDFVKEDLELTITGKKIPTIDIIVTTQNWSQFTQTWDFQDLDKNVSVPFITTVRQPEVKYGSNPSLQYTIPNRRQFYYAKVPTWDGIKKGMDIYKIPQPVPVDITYNVKIFCNRMRELNEFNKLILQKFSSRQAYREIKGHYIPIILDSINDESVIDIDKRKYFIQNYTFTMLGFLLDENEFEVSPAISRTLILSEFETKTRKKKLEKYPENPDEYKTSFLYLDGVYSQKNTFEYGTDLILLNSDNVESYDTYLNGIYIGSGVTYIPVSIGDELRIDILKKNTSSEAKITFEGRLVNSVERSNQQINLRENLVAGLNELEYLDGTPFPSGSLYHIHPEKGPMEGGTHSDTPHSYLRFITMKNPNISASETNYSNSSGLNNTTSGTMNNNRSSSSGSPSSGGYY
jgi:hypothetical protein